MIQLQENFWTDGQTEGRADGQTLFYRTLSDYHLGFMIQHKSFSSIYRKSEQFVNFNNYL